MGATAFHVYCLLLFILKPKMCILCQESGQYGESLYLLCNQCNRH